MLVAVAEAQHAKEDEEEEDDRYDFVAAYPGNAANWDEEIFKPGGDICGRWKTQLATDNANAQKYSAAKNVVYDADKNKIYLLAVDSTSTGSKWEYTLVVGEVRGSSAAKSIGWGSKQKNVEIKFENKLQSAKDFIGGFSTDGGGFVTSDGKIVFVLRATKNKKDNKNLIAFFGVKDDGNNPQLEVVHVEDTAEDCHPHFFLWGEKMVMITADCAAGNKQNVKVFTDITHWGESSGPFYYSSEFLKDKTSFTTAVVDGTNVLLFAQKKESDCRERKNCFAFWFSDGNRTHNVGENVVFSLSPEIVSSSLVYAKEKLFFLHHESASSIKKFHFTRLEEQSQEIKKTLNIWRESNNKIENLYKDTSTATTNINFIDGIVGFLSGDGQSTNDKEWKDQYLNVNAEITKPGTNAVRAPDGFKFSGAGAGAQWPVGKQENQRYNFINPGFTLVATVTIGSETKGADNSVLGVVLTEETKVGLWCSADGKWEVKNGQTKAQSPEINCAPDEKHYVALILNGIEKVSVYVDGQQLTESREINIKSSKNIEHFYFGAESGTQTAVTVTNVLLYNRPFTADEVKELKPRKDTEANNQQNQNTDTKQQNPEESATQNDSPLPKTSATEKEEAAQSSSPPPPPTTEDGAVRVGVVGVLCFMLCGVFTLLGRYVH